MIAIACDHAGIDLKPAVIAVLDELTFPTTILAPTAMKALIIPSTARAPRMPLHRAPANAASCSAARA